MRCGVEKNSDCFRQQIRAGPKRLRRIGVLGFAPEASFIRDEPLPQSVIQGPEREYRATLICIRLMFSHLASIWFESSKINPSES